MSTYYFAYGSNLWLDQMKKRCPEAIAITRAILRGWKLVFQECPTAKNVAATIIKGQEDDIVSGAVYAITNGDIENLDKFEKLDLDYIHQWVTIDVDEQRYECLTYQMMPECEEKLPSEEYVLRLFKGFLNWNIAINTSSLAPHCKHIVESEYLFERSIVTPILNKEINIDDKAV